MATFSASGSGYFAISVSITGLQYPANAYDSFAVVVYYGGNNIGSDYWSSSSSGSSTSHTITVPHSGSLYWIDAYAVYNGTQYFINGDSATTYTQPSDPQLPNAPSGLSVSGVGYTSATVSWNALSGATGYYYSFNGGSLQYTTSTSVSYTTLNPGTYYTFSVQGANNTYSSPFANTSWTTPSMPSRPQNWTAWDSLASGQSFHSGTSPITAAQWNAFTARINEFRIYKGMYSYPFTQVQAGWDFNATYIQEAAAAIPAGSPPTAGSGTTVTAAIFKGLATALNSTT